MTNIVVYARPLTEPSIEQQLENCRNFAKSKDYNIVHEYIEKSVSPDAVQRPLLQRMIKDSKRKQFQFALVYQPDCFSQDEFERALYKHFLRKNGVAVMSAMESTNEDIATEAMLEGMAAHCSLDRSKKISRGIAIKKEQSSYKTYDLLFGGFIEDNLEV